MKTKADSNNVKKYMLTDMLKRGTIKRGSIDIIKMISYTNLSLQGLGFMWRITEP